MNWSTATVSATLATDKFQVWLNLSIVLSFSVFILIAVLSGDFIANALLYVSGFVGMWYLFKKWRHRKDFDLALIEWEKELSDK